MLQSLVVWRVIWLPVVAVLTASTTSISPLVGQTEGSVVQRAGLGFGELVLGVRGGEGEGGGDWGGAYQVPQP